MSLPPGGALLVWRRSATPGYVFIAAARGERLRPKLSITGTRSTMVARCFSLKISNRAVARTMNHCTAEHPAKTDKNGRNIFRTSETRSNELIGEKPNE